MIILAADFGADPRLVAFMQYLRVTLVVLSASTVSRLLLGNAPQTHGVVATGPFEPAGFVITLAFAVGAGLGRALQRIPGGQFLVPLVDRRASFTRRASSDPYARRGCSTRPTRRSA